MTRRHRLRPIVAATVFNPLVQPREQVFHEANSGQLETASSGKRSVGALNAVDERWALLTALGLGVYFALLVLPRSVESSIEISEDIIRPYQMAGGLFFMMSAVIPLLVRPRLRAFVASMWRSRLGIGLSIVLGISGVISILVHGDVQSGAYAALTIGVLVSSSLYWAMNRRHLRIVSGLLAILGLAFAAITLWRFGVTAPGRFVGSLTPNHFANIVLTALTFGFLGPRLIRTLVIPLGVALIMPVNSRGALIAVAIAISVRWSIRFASERRVAAFGAMSCVVGLGALLVLHEGVQTLVADTAAEVFAVDDLARGMGSGGTGRTQMWEDAWAQISDRPLVGAGFRAIRLSEGRLTTAHNAYLDLAQEIGVPLTMVVMLLVVGACVRRVRVAAALDALEAPHHVWIAAALVALAVNAMLEVHLLNIGFPLGVAFMLLLMERENVAHAAAPVGKAVRRRRPLVESSVTPDLELMARG